MPYDPRPISVGGNRGIDEPEEVGGFSREAPPGMFRVIGVDTFDGGDWLDGDYKSLVMAQSVLREKIKGQKYLMMHIYDDEGIHLFSDGSF